VTSEVGNQLEVVLLHWLTESNNLGQTQLTTKFQAASRCVCSSRTYAHHGNGAEKCRVVRIDRKSFLEVELGQNKLLLFIIDHANAIPSQTHRQTLNTVSKTPKAAVNIVTSDNRVTAAASLELSAM